ncbi:bifunctional folylpolyglutamate synthase/dihydrofolate synthase [Parerythrobacter lacustris]|uniref:Bifunctional folylpolyglutamate synthase/dihydrofolate synthase n=1 Tax=Parerythrobacter lacustris TaxID=2969984 RepID=A0ABT1XSE7_9SPHN|nr:folylpolyglutamate synthase/dihydrofolate synthase family protein [Parerythrobacter lacustris]MCR2834565.1 bifunctional folylpolyglutamate synthase/dihydrofolate synthase [Parerythrobacter lacustris]
MDFATSTDPRVQAQLDRLAALSLPQGRLGLETIRALLARLGDPHNRLPPVFHVAGTNGKGSTCAFLRAMLEAGGKRVHMTTSPHLVRYNERIRLAGKLIEDGPLAELLEEVLDAADGLNPSFFEVTIAAAFLAFSRTPADACVVEVGLGGRFDATNVLGPEVLAACGIAALGIDHERFLLAPEDGVPSDPFERIAFEKAGILKRGVPFATLEYRPAIEAVISECAYKAEAKWFDAWHVEERSGGFDFISERGNHRGLPAPALPGAHQMGNAALAIAMLQVAGFDPGEAAIREGLAKANWPARLQRLSEGALTGTREVWLDGGHNRSAGEALARHFAGQRAHLVIGMIKGKDPKALLEPMQASLASVTAVPVPTHDCHSAAAFGVGAIAAQDVPTALAALPDDGLPVLIAGSLYLAGEVLRLNGEVAD